VGSASVNGAGVGLAVSAMARVILLVWERTKVRSLDVCKRLDSSLSFGMTHAHVTPSSVARLALSEVEARNLVFTRSLKVRGPTTPDAHPAPSERPAKQTLFFLDRQIVDAGKPPHHETGVVELPIFVARSYETSCSSPSCHSYATAPRSARSGTRPQFLDHR